jgi:hypothetical protein
VQGATRVQVFALDWEAERHLGVGGRVLEGGGHFERFHPVQVEGGRAVFFGIGDDLDMEVSYVIFFFVVGTVISGRGRDVFVD